jgi:hypothetical protein
MNNHDFSEFYLICGSVMESTIKDVLKKNQQISFGVM